MTRMTGGEALVRSLYSEGVRVIFGLPGEQLYYALEALYHEPGIRFIVTRHEQGAAYMADGFSRAGGGIGTLLVVPGPGLLNASSGIGTAFAASSPVLVLSGQVDRDLIGFGRGILHEVVDQLDCIRPITKWARRVLEPAEIPEAIHEAFYHLKTGRPRPVEVEIPPETLAQEADVELLEPEEYQPATASVDGIRKAARILAEAAKPLVWVGGGVISSGASDALLKVAEHLQAPIITTGEGKGAVSARHHLYLGTLGYGYEPLAQVIDQHDVLLAVGTRLADPHLLRGQKVVQIDVDPQEVGRNYPDTLGLVGDARRILEELYRELLAIAPQRPEPRPEFEALKASVLQAGRRVEPQESFTAAIRSAIPEDGILVAGETQIGYYSRTNYPVYYPKTFLGSSYFGNLGFAFPVALGAKVAQPDRAVVAISGDGGFLFNSQELAAAVQHGINAVVVLFNDNAYGNVMRAQITRFNGRAFGSQLRNPDFVKLAQAYGARGVRAQGPEELEAALREALAVHAPTLIEVPVGMMPSPFE